MISLFASSLVLPTVFLSGSDWTQVQDPNFYFEVPSYMSVADDLHDEAPYQYSYVEQVGKETMEVYFILLQETKEEIESYNLDYSFNALTYWQIAVENLTSVASKSKILTKEPHLENRNGMTLTRGNIYSKIGKIEVVYHVGVYEGDKAFYQLVSWTLKSQFEHFKADLEDIIESFTEKK